MEKSRAAKKQPLKVIFQVKMSGNKGRDSSQRIRPRGLLNRLGWIFSRKKRRASEELARYSGAIEKNPQNCRGHVHLAALYQKRGEKEKAIAEYLLAAGIYRRNQFYHQAMAIYKTVLRQEPELDSAQREMADLLREMGFLGDALAHYEQLWQLYEKQGRKEKSRELCSLIGEFFPAGETGGRGVHDQPAGSRNDPEGEMKAPFFDLRAELEAGEDVKMPNGQRVFAEGISGFLEIFREVKETIIPSRAYPDFHYHLGVACWKMGFVDEAIEELLAALENGQKSFETENLLARCYLSKGDKEQARLSFERALRMEGIPPDQKSALQRDLQLIAA